MSSDLRLYGRLLREARPCWPHMAALLALSLLATPIALLVPLPLKIAVDSVIGSHPAPAFLPASDTGLLLAIAAILVAITAVQHAVRLATSVLQAYTGERLVLRFRTRLFDHGQRLSLAYHDTRGSADAIFRIQYDALAIQKIAVDAVTPLVTAVFTVVGMIVVTARIDWQLAAVAVVLSPLLALGSWHYRARVRPRWREAKKLETSALSVVQEVLSGLRVVRAFGQEEREQRRFADRSAEGMRTRVHLTVLQGGFGFAVGLLTALGTATVLYVGVTHVQSGRITLGALLLVMTYLAQLYDPLETATAKTASLQGALANAERAFELLDQRVDVPERPGAQALTRSRGAVAFRNVTFAYEPGRPVLHGVTFQATPGAHIAIAGPTGTGKTTIASLLMRFYDPGAGRIELDGTDVRDLRVADLRRQFAIVLQDPLLLSTSIAENIAYARPDATPAEIEAAARAAHAHDFIAALPEGYDTLVGERGLRLSGGERQRISLARAFLKDAPILILDEATSAVDVDTEALIVDAVRRLMAGRTTFVIAHRLTTLADCDLQLDIADGRIARVRLPAAAPPRPAPLDGLLAGTGEPGLGALRAALAERFGADARLLAHEPLKRRVHRIHLLARGTERALVLKRLEPHPARCNTLALRSWLPAAGLEQHAPALEAVAADRDGDLVWHAYADIGDGHLEAAPRTPERAATGIRLLAELHGRFADHARLPECRFYGHDLGARYLDLCVREAAAALERVRASRPAGDHALLCDLLLTRLDAILTELPARAEALVSLGGPETLLHGDAWTTNVFVDAYGHARLIDWDRAGVGPAAYDLSTFLLRFPDGDRPALLAAYRATLATHGRILPPDDQLDEALQSAELARIASRAVWPAVAVLTGEPEWGWDELGRVATWLGDLEPVLA